MSSERFRKRESRERERHREQVNQKRRGRRLISSPGNRTQRPVGGQASLGRELHYGSPAVGHSEMLIPLSFGVVDL